MINGSDNDDDDDDDNDDNNNDNNKYSELTSGEMGPRLWSLDPSRCDAMRKLIVPYGVFYDT